MSVPHPPVHSPATLAHPQEHRQHRISLQHASIEHDYTYNEKDGSLRRQSAHTERGYTGKRGHDSVISYTLSSAGSATPSPHSSIASKARYQPTVETESPVPRTNPQNVSYPQPAHLDPEKGYGYTSSQGRQSAERESSHKKEVVYDQGRYYEGGAEEKAWPLLFYLSGPCALLSIGITFWTIAALIILLVLAPLRFCCTRPSLSTQLESFLAPALNLQLHLVYSHNSKTGFCPFMLIIIHLFSPIIALGIAISAWVAACFWFFSAILGDPHGPEGPNGHNDGKESILAVKNWWERWLVRALR